jgi:hypothetical protein
VTPVGAGSAHTTTAADSHARVNLHNPLQQVTEAMWRIQYPHLDLTDKTN